MIHYHARKPIRDFLNKVTEPPYSLTIEEHNQCFEAILGVYEETTNKERESFLCTDVFDMVRTYAAEDKAIQSPRDTHWSAMSEIRLMLAGLIAEVEQYGVRLPDSELKLREYDSLKFIGRDSFATFVRETYKSKDGLKKHYSGTNAAGRGNDATTPSGTPTGAQEARKEQGKPGRPPKEFDEYFNNPNEAEAIIPILARMLKGKKAKDAARIIIAFYEGGWTIERPSLSSIERRFHLKHSNDIGERIKCQFRYKELQVPKYKPFPPEELNPIIVAIKREIAKQQPPQNTEK